MSALADFTIKQHDTWKPISATLSDASGVVSLAAASAVKLIAKGTTAVITGACTITDAPNGRVLYQWAAGDTAIADTYNLEFEVSYANGTVETFPNDSYLTLVIVADLG